MNKLLVLTTALALGGLGLTAIASPYERGPYGPGSGNRIERMAEHLNLTNDQQEKIKALFETHKKQRQAMREQMHSEIGAVLNDEQKTRFDAMKQYRQERRMNRMAKHGGKYCNQERHGHWRYRFDD
jgi:Spy/CpxP family protein refolding chaperone